MHRCVVLFIHVNRRCTSIHNKFVPIEINTLWRCKRHHYWCPAQFGNCGRRRFLASRERATFTFSTIQNPVQAIYTIIFFVWCISYKAALLPYSPKAGCKVVVGHVSLSLALFPQLCFGRGLFLPAQ